MQARDFARRLIEAETLAEKLVPPPSRLYDAVAETSGDPSPPSPLRLGEPGRPPELAILPARQVKVPPAGGMSDPQQRGRILHALANHELQAVELFAWALLAFPRHTGVVSARPTGHPGRRAAPLSSVHRLHGRSRRALRRLRSHRAFLAKIADVSSPLGFVCTMGLTFENANLDFAGEYTRHAERAGDLRTCAALETVHRDEIRHVRFAWCWLGQLPSRPGTLPDADPWAKYLAHVVPPLGPARARGKEFDRQSREAAGLDSEFIAKLQMTAPRRPSGAAR